MWTTTMERGSHWMEGFLDEGDWVVPRMARRVLERGDSPSKGKVEPGIQ